MFTNALAQQRYFDLLGNSLNKSSDNLNALYVPAKFQSEQLVL